MRTTRTLLPALLAPALLLGCGGAWQAGLHADNPLVGRVWSTRDHAFVDPATLGERLRGARYVLLGERHDHPDHHRLQALLVAALPGRPAAFEMLDEDDRTAVASARSAAELAEAVDWAHSGWPPFELYEPVFAVLYAEGRRVLVAHPTKATLRAAFSHGLPAEPTLAPMSEAALAELADEIRESHCGHAPESIIEPMSNAQRLKDAGMARALRDAGEPVVLVAGNGHVRTDRGVPLALPEGVLSVGLLEVSAGKVLPTDYPDHFDYVYFTPRLDDDDPCEKYREQLEKMRATAPRG